MQKLALLAAAAALFAALPWAASPASAPCPPLLVAAALVAPSVAAALAASGRVAAVAVTAGAVGALGSGLLFGPAPAVAGALALAAAYAERASRVRGRGARAAHFGAALAAGAVAGPLTAAFAGDVASTYGVALAVAAVLSALPLLVDADDPVAHALEALAGAAGPAARTTLLEGAELRRAAAGGAVDRKTARRVRASWASLVRLGEARAKLERSARPAAEGALAAGGKRSAAADVAAMLERHIADHVGALARAYAAADAVSAATLGLDDRALRRAETVGESLDEVGRAMVEIKDP